MHFFSRGGFFFPTIVPFAFWFPRPSPHFNYIFLGVFFSKYLQPPLSVPYWFAPPPLSIHSLFFFFLYLSPMPLSVMNPFTPVQFDTAAPRFF